MGTAVLGESLASRRVGVMTDDNDGVTSASGLNGSLSLCLTSLSLCSFFFSFLSSSFTFSVMFTAEFFFFFFLIYMGHGLSEFFFFFLIYMGHGLFKTPRLAGWLG